MSAVWGAGFAELAPGVKLGSKLALGRGQCDECDGRGEYDGCDAPQCLACRQPER